MVYDSQKGREILKYMLSKGEHDMYRLLKAVYYADQYHLSHYGRQVNGNTFLAMQHGPVPSEMYDFAKNIRCGAVPSFYAMGNALYCRDTPDPDWLSESDLEALDYGLSEVDGLQFDELKMKSHDNAYLQTELNQPISIESIIAQLNNADLITEYLNR